MSALVVWEDELQSWPEPFLKALHHPARWRMCHLYVAGLISPGERKNLSPLRRASPLPITISCIISWQSGHGRRSFSPVWFDPLASHLLRSRAVLCTSSTATCRVFMQSPDSYYSSTLEKILELHFLAGLTAEVWRLGERRIEVLSPMVDNAGVDFLLEVSDRARHIQLKTLVRGGKRNDFSLNTRLAGKPSGCVIVILYDPTTLEIGPFLWLGSAPGQPLPDLGTRLARHTKGNKDGLKLVRPGHRLVRRSAFVQVDTMGELVERLFGAIGPGSDKLATVTVATGKPPLEI